MTNQTLVQLVNQMAENAAKNPYIVRALETLENKNFPTLQTKLKQEGKAVIPTVVTLAFVLEKISNIATTENNENSHHLWESCQVADFLYAEP